MPKQVIKLPEMELMERGVVASYLIKTCIEHSGDMAIHRITVADSGQYNYPGKEIQDRAVSEWLQGVVRLAILSHTWWQEEEPSYKTFSGQCDCERKWQKTVRGYGKLQQFCNIVHRVYGVEFAWADTICIDKSTSMELDESIHSMFAWYRNLDICITHLVETTDLLDCPSDLWFTHGWTLQEILALDQLKFYNKDWHPLTNFVNNKITTFNKEWLKETGQINQDSSYSHQFHLHHAIFMAMGLGMATIVQFRPGIHAPSLPECMKWVSQRVTTRAEDKAYHMMGVFGVSISIA